MPVNVHYNAPRKIAGYELEPLHGFFSVIQPEAGQNLLTNPSFETATTGMTATDCTLARSTAQQYFGLYGLQIVPTSAVNAPTVYTTLGLVSGTVYTFSIYIKGTGGFQYCIYITDNAGALVSTQNCFKATGKWQRVKLVYQAAATATHRLYLSREISAILTPFYTDGWMMQDKPYLTTYIDGDQKGLIDVAGYPAYRWNGTPHASSSQRYETTRAGGRLRSLNYYGFRVLSFLGLGMPLLQIASQSYGYLDGGLYQGSRVTERSFTLIGYFAEQNFNLLKARRASLYDTVNPNLMQFQQPLLLRYTPFLCDDDYESEDDRYIQAVYASGLGQTTDNLYQERTGIEFIAHLPYISSGKQSAVSLNTRRTFTINQLAIRDRLGNWSDMATGITGGSVTINANGFLLARDGRIYITGNFTNAFGVAAANIAVYDPATGTGAALGTGLTGGSGYGLAEGPDGNIYVVGSFTGAGGIAGTTRVAVWNPVAGTWAAFGGGADNNVVRDIAFTVDGIAYISGSFTAVNGGTAAAGIAKISGGVFVAIGTGLAGAGADGWALEPGFSTGEMYVVGSFTTANGVTVNYIARTDGTTFYALAGGANNPGYDIKYGKDGKLYATGAWTTIGGIAAQYFSAWNGSQWQPLGSGLNSPPIGSNLSLAANGKMFISGSGAIETVDPDDMVIWTGSNYELIAATSTGVAGPVLAPSSSGYLVVNFAGGAGITGVFPGMNIVNNPGATEAWPKVVVNGPGFFYELRNYTTGQFIQFDNLQLQTGETVTIDLTPNVKTLISNTRGDVSGYLIPSSDIQNWRLLPGDNYVTLFVNDASATAAMTWNSNYLSLDK